MPYRLQKLRKAQHRAGNEGFVKFGIIFQVTQNASRHTCGSLSCNTVAIQDLKQHQTFRYLLKSERSGTQNPRTVIYRLLTLSWEHFKELLWISRGAHIECTCSLYNQKFNSDNRSHTCPCALASVMKTSNCKIYFLCIFKCFFCLVLPFMPCWCLAEMFFRYVNQQWVPKLLGRLWYLCYYVRYDIKAIIMKILSVLRNLHFSQS